MHFPNTGSGRPYVRIDGRSGAFALSIQDGDPEIFEMRGKLLDVDLATADQGWLRLSTEGADWVPLNRPDDWTNPPRPSVDHAPAVRVSVYHKGWPAPAVRELRASSRAVTGFIARIAEQAGEIPEDRAVRVKVGAARVIRIGKGTSVDLGFQMAPREKWPPRAHFDEAAKAEPASAKAAPSKPGDAVDDYSDLETADEWA